MKSNRELATVQMAGLHSARSQEKHEYDIDKQEDYNYGKNDYSLHIQGHGAMQNTVVFQWHVGSLPQRPLLCCSTAMVQTLSSSRHWRRELSIPLAQSAISTTPSPAPQRLLANRWHSEAPFELMILWSSGEGQLQVRRLSFAFMELCDPGFVSGVHVVAPWVGASEKEFREMVIRWLKRMEDKFDNMSKNQEEMKKNQEEMKNDITAVKNSIESIKSRLEEAEDHISELEDKMGKNTQLQQLLETKIRKHEESLRELWDNTKQNNIKIIGVPEGKETEQGIENLFEEIITENFPDIGKKKPTQIQEAHRVPSKMNPKRPTLRHIIIKLANTNDKGSKRETSQSSEDFAPGATPCSCRQSTTSATESSNSKQFTEDEEQEEDEPDNRQPGDHLGHGKEDGRASEFSRNLGFTSSQKPRRLAGKTARLYGKDPDNYINEFKYITQSYDLTWHDIFIILTSSLTPSDKDRVWDTAQQIADEAHTHNSNPIGTLAVPREGPDCNYQLGHQNREARNRMLDNILQALHRLANKAVNYDKIKEITQRPEENPGEFLECLSQVLQKYTRIDPTSQADKVNPIVCDTSNPSVAKHHTPVLIHRKNPDSFPFVPQYPVPTKHLLGFKPTISKLLNSGLLRPTNSPFNTPILPVIKPKARIAWFKTSETSTQQYCP
ncbi:hypothetical protein QTO34_000710 [Cnephaeus nilssonii]|uniref:Uncharacterized protein n=1 Tax=Cnephaeus nilssonii TaxID=3371016 RepID=A0AA40ICZ0_CNENI|nr:hypothetical protein QTO34_000710 [Eptesicus nilssonii]